MKNNYSLIFLIFLLTLKICGQNKKCVEEIAFFHLDSLNKIEPKLKRIKYFANGYISKDNTELTDTLFNLGSPKNIHLKSIFKDLKIIENENLSSITIPKSKRGRQNDTGLKIYHFAKKDNFYFVQFEILNDGGIDIITIKMNEFGEMINYYHGGGCF